MNELLNTLGGIVPEKARPYLLALFTLSPFIGRAYHALANGGGLRGLFGAIWLGTNSAVPKTQVENPAQGKLPLSSILFLIVPCSMIIMAGCAEFKSAQIKTEADGTKTESRQRIVTFFDGKSEISKLRATTTDKTQGLTVGSIAAESSGTNTVDLLHAVTEAAVSAAVKSVAPK